MNNLFVTHLDHDAHLINLIELNYARSSLYSICGILFLLIAVSFVLGRRKTGTSPADSSLFSIDSTLALKGVAIILLLLGHVSQQCTVGSEALPFRITGNAAVIIFLFVSGVGLAKKYHLQVDKLFWLKRVKKLAMPVWLSLTLIVPLNFLLIGYTDPVVQLVLNFCGIFWTKFPDSPCWFITYIIFIYAVYFIAALLPVNRITQIAVLFLLPFIAGWLIIETESIDHFKLWPQYSLVFPAGVVCGLNAHHLKKLNDKLFNFFPIVFIVCMLILLGLYWTGLAVYRISHLISFELYTQLVFALVNPVALILFLIFFVGLLEARGLKSGMLQFLGKYSFEVYLLHFPFMVYYDFFIFRRPLVFFFFVYAIFVLLLSVLLQRASVCLDGFISRKIYADIH
jgi:peptidoglycan/LPS O-acetylase OafA/YrhL